MLVFTEKLKEILYDVEINGGNLLQKYFPPFNLTQHLRQYITNTLAKTNFLPGEAIALFEDIRSDIFEEIVRSSLIILAEFGIKDENKVREILERVIDTRLKSLGHPEGKIGRKYYTDDEIYFDEALIQNRVSASNFVTDNTEYFHKIG